MRQRLRSDPSRATILVVDMLYEFPAPGGEMVLLKGRNVIEPINQLVAANGGTGRGTGARSSAPASELRSAEMRTTK
jgi:hypothetical protein